MYNLEKCISKKGFFSDSANLKNLGSFLFPDETFKTRPSLIMTSRPLNDSVARRDVWPVSTYDVTSGGVTSQRQGGTKHRHTYRLISIHLFLLFHPFSNCHFLRGSSFPKALKGEPPWGSEGSYSDIVSVVYRILKARGSIG